MRMFGRRKATVLGAGPAGLLAAYALEKRGWEVSVLTAPDKHGRPQKSELHGCQYLHSFIHGLTEGAGRRVSYLLEGSTEDYRRKVYGENWDGQVSPDEFGPEQEHLAWDLREAYDKLWRRLRGIIVPMRLTPEHAAGLAGYRGMTVVSTVPAPALCLKPDEHKFPTQDVWAMGSRSDGEPYWTLPYSAPNMTVLCNGNDAPRWYRAATVFGHSTLEWPMGPKPPVQGVVRVQKPLSTDCTCHIGQHWYRLGRYGLWQKGVLVHTAYHEAAVLR